MLKLYKGKITTAILAASLVASAGCKNDDNDYVWGYPELTITKLETIDCQGQSTAIGLGAGGLTVPPSGTYKITFSGKLDEDTLGFNLSDAFKKVVITEQGGDVVQGTFLVDENAGTVTFQPAQELKPLTTYVITVKPGIVGFDRTTGGRLEFLVEFNFIVKTSDARCLIGAFAVSIDPADGSTNVPVHKNVVFSFNSQPNLSTLPTTSGDTANIRVYKVDGGSETLLTGSFNWDGTVLTFDPASDLEYASEYRALVTPSVQGLGGETLPGEITSTFTTEEKNSICVEEYTRENTQHAFWLPGIATDFIFETPGELIQHSDGTARLRGTIRSRSLTNYFFEVDIRLSDRVVDSNGVDTVPTLANGYPDGSPKNPQTGSTDDWRYYATLEGTLTGRGDLEGAIVQVKRRGQTQVSTDGAPVFQMGTGANDKDGDYGASAWLDWTVVQQPTDSECVTLPQTSGHGDINVDLLDCSTFCPTAANFDEPNLYGVGTAGHAIWIPGMGAGHKWAYVNGAHFTEYPNGTAHLYGTIQNLVNTNQMLTVDVWFTGKTTTPPHVDSPKLELDSSAYLSNGGPIDPSTWYYYSSFSGFLTGTAGPGNKFAGKVFEVEQRGPSFQLGYGANGKNTAFGASAWFWAIREVGRTEVWYRGDFNIDLSEGACVETSFPKTACECDAQPTY